MLAASYLYRVTAALGDNQTSGFPGDIFLVEALLFSAAGGTGRLLAAAIFG